MASSGRHITDRTYYEAVARFSEATSNDDVFVILKEELRKFVRYHTLAIYQADNEKKVFHPIVVEGSANVGASLESWSIPFTQGIVGSIISSAKGEIINNAHRDQRSVYPSDHVIQTEHMIAVPMRLGKICWGAMAINRIDDLEYRESDFQVAQFLAAAAAMALNNVKLLAESYEREENLREILHTIPDHPLRVNVRGEILTQALTNDNGYSTIYELFPVEIADRYILAMSNLDPQHSQTSFEYDIELSDQKRYYEASIFRLKSGEFLLLSRDITEKKENVQVLIRAKQEAEELMNAKQDFLAKMSHELRTPINGVLGLANLIATEQLGSDDREYVDGIKASGEHLLAIINDILDLSKIEAGKMDLEAVEFDPGTVLTNAVKILKPQADSKGIALHANIDASMPYVHGDAVRLSQVLMNLISNAIKFTEVGSVRVEAETQTRASKTNLVVRVIDTGIGIEEKHLSVIFDKFSQGDPSTSSRFGGTGLGLAIVKRLLELQNGDILVSSQPGKGSCFEINIPYGACANPLSKEKSTHVEFHHFKGARVLLVEDNPVNQLVGRKTLENWELRVQIAQNGLEALNLLREHLFELIIMDVQMPVMDGFEATRLIRTTLPKPTQTLPIIAMTASVLYNPRERILAAGMNDYISKPFNPVDLNRMIARYIEPVPVHRPLEEEETTQSGQLDFSYLEKLSPGNESFKLQLVEIFEKESQRYVRELHEAIHQNDTRQVARVAHAFKPIGAYLGLHKLSTKVGNLEQMAYEQKPTDEIQNGIEQIEEIVNLSLQQIIDFKKTLVI